MYRRPYIFKKNNVNYVANNGDVFQTESNGLTEVLYDKLGNYIIGLDDNNFNKYFEIIDDEQEIDGVELAKKFLREKEKVVVVKAIKNYNLIGNGDIEHYIFKGNKYVFKIENNKYWYQNEFICDVENDWFYENFKIIDDEKVNHPEHYNQGEIETIDVIEYVLSDINGKYAFALGNIIKYVVRANMKGGKEDLDKAKWYIERLIGGFNE